MEINELTKLVLDSSIKIHTKIGPGCFEKVYEETLFFELKKQALIIDRQVLMPITYENLNIENAYKIDLLIENMLIIEIKSVDRLSPVHFQQVKTYLKLMKLKNGILLNFNTDLMKNGFNRIYNNQSYSL
jgi:GxxExxY protein